MAYLGKAPINGFHAKQSITGDGSTVTFTLDQTVANETSIIVSVGGVIQEPKTAYNLANGGASITFTAAPASTDRVYVQFLGTAIVQNLNDAGGAELILDADNDTSFTADTDDEIDIKVGGSDRSTIKATGFHNLDSIKFVAGTGDDLQLYHDGTNSFLTNSTGALKLATETSGIAVTIGHSTSEVTVADNLTVTGNLTVGGTTSFGDFDITNVGSIALDTITNDGTDITLDSSGDIILDADGADVIFKDAGTEISRFTNSSSDFIIQTAVSDKDFVIKGNDGGSTITPFTLDMSAGGDLFLTGGLIDLKNDGSAVSQIKFYCESSNAHAQTLIGAPHSESATNTLTLPGTGGNARLVSTTSTATLTNKTLTSPQITTSIIPSSADGATIGSASAEFSDIFLADSSTIQFGNDQDTTLTHTDGAGLTLNSTNKLMFNDASQFIQGSSATVLSLGATDEIDLTATTIDINGTANVSGTFTASGDAVVGNDIYLNTDDSVIYFGVNGEAQLIHDHNVGLKLKHSATADDKPVKLTLQTGETDIAANDVLGAIDFQAPDEATGTDAILVAAGIEAVSEGDFSSSNNATKLSFKTAASAAAAETMSLSSVGLLTIADDLVIGDGKTIGISSDTDLITLADGIATVAGELSVTTLDIGGTNVTSTAAELNYVDGVTSNVQTQIDTKASTGKAIAMAIVFG